MCNFVLTSDEEEGEGLEAMLWLYSSTFESLAFHL